MSKKVIKTAEVIISAKARVLPLQAHLVSRLTRAEMVLDQILADRVSEGEILEEVIEKQENEDGDLVDVVVGTKVVGHKKFYNEYDLCEGEIEHLDTMVRDLIKDIMHAIEEDDDDYKCK